MSTHKDIPGVIAPPPLIFLSFLLAGIGIDAALHLALFAPGTDEVLRWAGGGALLALGMLAMGTAIRGFSRAGTPVPTRAPTTALVTTGAHGLSRNPIYISLYLYYLGIAVLSNSVAALVLVPPLALVIRYLVVAREERYLEQKFGEDYLAYKSRVPRWL